MAVQAQRRNQVDVSHLSEMLIVFDYGLQGSSLILSTAVVGSPFIQGLVAKRRGVETDRALSMLKYAVSRRRCLGAG